MNRIRLAGCVVYNNKGELLLIHRNSPNRTQWELPGGKIDEGENPKTTAKRELLEELGVEVRIVRKLGEKSFQEDGYTMDYIWFLAEIKKGIPVLKEEKFNELKYFSWDKLTKGKLKLSENTKNLVQSYVSNELSAGSKK